jgi:hypothetical protein
MNPRQPYAGIKDAKITRIISIRKLLYENRRWKYGQASEPSIPDEGVITPIMIKDDADM